MAKKLNLKLSIQKPCKQEWDGMTPNTTGRYCDSCNKTVVDFSNFTDKELVDFFKNATGEICGRVSSTQCNRLMPVLEKSNNTFLYKALFGAALVTGIATVANGQNTIPIVSPAHITIPSAPVNVENNQDKPQPKKNKDQNVRGIIKDAKTKEPLQYVEVIVDGISLSTSTDSAGNFEINIPDSLLGKKLELEFYKGWHKSVKMNVNTAKLPYYLKINMEQKKERMVMGRMAYSKF
jgi:hypothetical protein